MNKLINIIQYVFVILIFASCGDAVKNAKETGTLPSIFPDYKDVCVPVNIAPLNFEFTDSCEVLYVDMKGKEGVLSVSGENKIDIPVNKWHKFLQKNAGETIAVNVFAKKNGQWFKYQPFSINISKDSVNSYLVYRLISPGYESWGEMGIYQRNLTDFTEEPIVNSKLLTGSCMNCHSFCQNNPDNMLLHLRENHGGTILIQDGKIEKLKTKTDNTISNCVYPYWHPSGRYVAFSTNKTSQVFHAIKDKRIEVVDSKSDVVVYDIKNNTLLTTKYLFSSDCFETFPSFSADGKTLYFCSSKVQVIPDDYDKVKYSLCSIAFDPETGKFGDKVDTLVSASKTGKSVAFPRISPNGKYLMFTMSAYGNFFIWHKDADLYLMDLNTKQYQPLDGVNSNDVDSYHSWNSNSHWFVFSSRRIDGLYTRPFIAHIDENGKTCKPFLLPQKDPDFYKYFMKSYNIPELIVKKVNVDAYKIEAKAKEGNGKSIGFKKQE